MKTNELNNEYFEWMCQLVCNEEHYLDDASYRKLLTFLNNMDFNYIICMDGNREEDGFDLRYRFGYERGYSNTIIANLLDIKACSILEMMVALSIRCEENIMADPDIGNRTAQWFLNMLSSLGLDRMSDNNFNRQYANKIISTFLDRKYERNGNGGLFTVNNCKYDLRSAEIWYQMCWYLDSII